MVRERDEEVKELRIRNAEITKILEEKIEEVKKIEIK